jgi:hypothetical protein
MSRPPEPVKKLSLKKLVDWILATVRPRRARKRRRITVRYLI